MGDPSILIVIFRERQLWRKLASYFWRFQWALFEQKRKMQRDRSCGSQLCRFIIYAAISFMFQVVDGIFEYFAIPQDRNNHFLGNVVTCSILLLVYILVAPFDSMSVISEIGYFAIPFSCILLVAFELLICVCYGPSRFLSNIICIANQGEVVCFSQICLPIVADNSILPYIKIWISGFFSAYDNPIQLQLSDILVLDDHFMCSRFRSDWTITNIKTKHSELHR